MKSFLRCGLSLLTAALPLTAMAQSATTGRPFLDPLFTDGMVLQRGMSDPVWGWTTPGATVTVSVAGRSAAAKAGADGAWTAKLPPLPVGGPDILTVSGPQRVTLTNVEVGDVWLCSGQSNMQYGIGNLPNKAQEIAAADYPLIRLYTVSKPPEKSLPLQPAATIPGQWEVCTPANVRTDGDWNGFSAVGYFFGRDLYENLHVPIGLIHSSWGGTPAEAWTSPGALQTVPGFRHVVAQLQAIPSDGASMAQVMTDWYQKYDPGQAGDWQAPALNDASWKTMALPGYFQNAGDPTLANINGVVWFRKSFALPDADAGKAAVLHFYADDNDTTWVNGTEVGATEGYNILRAYPIPARLLKPTGNVIAVRVLDTGGMGGIWGEPGSLSLAVPGSGSVPLTGDWRYKLGVPLTDAPLPLAPVNSNTPTVLYNAMVHPLMPFAIKGVIWYQGENNAGSVTQGIQYRTLLPTMIQDWRSHWGQGDFPFLIVQLAGYSGPPAQPGDDGWAEVRAAQWHTSQTLPNAGIATAVDIGNPTNIHPTDKQDVGKRLALVAEAMVYHEKVHDSGPVYRSMKVEGSAIRLSFDHLGGGLVTQGGGPLEGFAIAGTDQKWAWASARIEGNSVVVSSPQVPHPVAVRYAWASYMANTLANRAGLPAFPFRTDHWAAIAK